MRFLCVVSYSVTARCNGINNALRFFIIFQLEETELYVTELKDHVIIQEQNDDQMYNEEDVLNIPAEETVADEEVGHLVDGEVRIGYVALPFEIL